MAQRIGMFSHNAFAWAFHSVQGADIGALRPAISIN